MAEGYVWMDQRWVRTEAASTETDAAAAAVAAAAAAASREAANRPVPSQVAEVGGDLLRQQQQRQEQWRPWQQRHAPFPRHRQNINMM